MKPRTDTVMLIKPFHTSVYSFSCTSCSKPKKKNVSLNNRFGERTSKFTLF